MSRSPESSRGDTLRMVADSTPHSVEAMVDLARLAEARGQRDAARELYERALHALDPRVHSPLVLTLLLGVARTHFDAGNLAAAAESIETLLTLAPAGNDPASLAQVLELRGRVRWGQGALDLAHDDFAAARQRAVECNAGSLAALLSTNLGALAIVRGELSSAAQIYEGAVDEYRALEDEVHVALTLGQLAPLHADLRRWNTAEQEFAEAVRLATAQSDQRALVRLEIGRAEMAVQRGNFERARASCDRALELARRGDLSPQAQAQALALSGIIARELGDLTRAERQLDQAERLALDSDDALLAAETAKEKADLFGRQERHQQTLLALNRAYRLLSQLRGRRLDIDVARRLRRLEEGFVDVVRRWAQRIESKDHATAGHCDRVAELTCEVARRMGIDAAALFWYRVGALLHDIGKLSIPGAILNKAGRLSADEWALVKRHPSAGAELLAEVDFPWEVRPIVESHHECWDGSGYPHGLAGSQIPLAARIFAVADVFDALVSHRSFKQALSAEEAVDVMRRDVGRQFDPAIFKVFEEIVRERMLGSSPLMVVARTTTTAPPIIDDTLTSVADRPSFMQHAAVALAERRGTSQPAALLTVDIDWFRLINDAYGRLQGDDILWAIAKVLQRGIRAGDLVGRRGGDEFLVLLPDATSKVALEVAERLRLATEEMRCVRRDAPEETVALTLSIGVACAPADGDSPETLLAAADRALFRAKREGRNRVVQADDAPQAPEEARLALDHFVGREEELRELVTGLDAASRGEPQVIALVGEAGIGKSALVRQLEPEVRLRSGLLVVGRCADGEMKSPLAPWGDIVAQLHDAASVPARPWPALATLVPRLADAAAFAEPPSLTLQDELVHFVRLATRARPLVIVLEDVHWADSATWDAIEALAAVVDKDRLLLCLTMRAEEVRHVSERRRRLAQRRAVRQVSLRRFSLDELRRWVQSVFHDGALGQEFPAFLFEYTEGIPLFVVHVLRALSESGGIWYGGTRWEWRPIDELALPAAIGEVLERRLDRLSPGARSVLAAGAVIGPSFELDLLIAAASATEPQVRAAIEEGVSAAVLETSGSARSGRFSFTHALLADACRRGIPERQRQRTHEVAARMLELRAPTSVGEIAAHYHASGNDEQAFRYAVLAAERASSVHAHDEAIDCLLIAQRHAPSPVELAALRVQLAEIAEAAGRYEYAEEMCDLAVEWFARHPDPLRDARARRLREELRVRRGRRPQRAVAELQRLLTQDAGAPGTPAERELLLALAAMHNRLADWPLAEDAARRALELLQGADGQASLGDASLQLGVARFASAPAESFAFLRDAVSLLGHEGDLRGRSRAWHATGIAHLRSGSPDQALEAFSVAADAARLAHDADASAQVALALGELHLQRGALDVAADWFGDAARLCATLRDEPGRLHAAVAQAHLARERGDARQARELYDTAGALARELGIEWLEAICLAGAALSAWTAGEEGADIRWSRVVELLAAARPEWWFPGHELVDALATRVALGRGDPALAGEHFSQAMASLEGRDTWGACWLAADCATLLVEAGVDGGAAAWQRAGRRAAAHSYAALAARLGG